MQFDARAAKSLQPKQHITIDGYPGLRLEASAIGRSWTYRYKSPVDGRMRQIKIGGWPAMSLPAAIVAWEALRTQREAGEDPAALARAQRAEAAAHRAAESRRRAAGVRTVRDVCDYYLAGHIDINRAAKGAAEIRRTFDKMLGDLAVVDAAAVTRTLAFELIQQYAHIPVQAGILRRELGAAWEYCLDAGKLPEDVPNWWRLILRGKLKSKGRTIKGKKQGTRKRSLSPSEVVKLLPWLPNFSRTVADALTLYLWTGTRGAEIVVIEGSEVSDEPDGLWWTLPKHKTKNARHSDATDHRVPLIGRAAEIIRRRKEAYGDGFLFPGRAAYGHVEQKAISLAVYYHRIECETSPDRPRPRLDMAIWTPHDLRRTARTFLASLGCPRDAGEVILGHMLEGVEGTYNRHTYDRERREWLQKLSDYLTSLA